jgi:hypothetical protein
LHVQPDSGKVFAVANISAQQPEGNTL